MARLIKYGEAERATSTAFGGRLLVIPESTPTGDALRDLDAFFCGADRPS